MDLIALENQATLGCVSPSGLATHGVLQPVVTTTGRGYASPSGLRKSKGLKKALRLQFGFRPGGSTQPLPGSKASLLYTF